MLRKQVYIEPEHERLLKARSAALGVTEAELIRQSLESLGRQVHATGVDPESWQAELSFLKQRASLKSPQGKRTWTRESLHER